MVLVTPLVALMFERGRFTAAHTRLTAIGLFWYAPGLVAMGACAILTRAFYALLETRIPFYLAILQVSTNIVLSTLLAMTPLQHGGLALATTIAFWTEIALLLVMLRRLLARQGRRLSLHGLWDGLGRMTIAGAVMAVATSGSLTVLSHHFARSRLLGKAALLGVPGVVGLAAYFVAAALLRCDEAHECLRLLRRRSAPRKP
jgi:putative peptidoglycan lipid II flippase